MEAATMASLEARLNATEALLAQTQADAAVMKSGVDAAWTMLCTFFVLSMQAGFAMLESGMIRANHSVSVALKNMLDFGVGTLAFYVVGYGIAYGGGDNAASFAGNGGFFAANLSIAETPFWLFQMSFSATSSTIVSGGVCGRMKVEVYVWVTIVMCTCVYPFVAHWVWSAPGFLRQMGFVDIAGGGPVHVVGGYAALIATMTLGARTNLFKRSGAVRSQVSSPQSVVLGMFALWVGWFGFNSGSSGGMNVELAGRAGMTTAISSASALVTAVVVGFIISERSGGATPRVNVYKIITGTLAGLASITAGCAVVGTWEAMVIGSVGALLALLISDTLIAFRVDDPVDAFPVHGAGATWGLLAVGLFADVERLGPRAVRAADGSLKAQGLIHGGGMRLLGVQALGVVVVTLWSVAIVALVLVITDRVYRIRVPAEEELYGLNAGVGAGVDMMGRFVRGTGDTTEDDMEVDKPELFASRRRRSAGRGRGPGRRAGSVEPIAEGDAIESPEVVDMGVDSESSGITGLAARDETATGTSGGDAADATANVG